MTDKARAKTDKMLDQMEAQIGRVYSTSPALKRIKKEYEAYMKKVQEKTADLYAAYKDADEESKKALKEEYTKEVQALTIGSAEYRQIIKKFTEAMAQANGEALAVANGSMSEIYALNYNQAAEECERVGIKVNG